MPLTMETGIRIPGGSPLIFRYCQIAKAYGCRHFQVRATSSVQFQRTSHTVRGELGTRMELSYYLNGPDKATHGLLQQFDGILQTAFEYDVKFLIIPLHILQNFELQGAPMSSTLESLARKTEELHIFLCLEVAINSDGVGSSDELLRYLADLKQSHPSRFFLFSISMTSLLEASYLQLYTKRLRMFIASMHLTVNQPSLTASVMQDHFAELIEHLYWLPFDQQPLVFTNPLRDLERVFDQFLAIVESHGYWYT